MINDQSGKVNVATSHCDKILDLWLCFWGKHVEMAELFRLLHHQGRKPSVSVPESIYKRHVLQ